MNPSNLIQSVEDDGITLSISSTGKLKYAGETNAVNRWLADIRDHKDEIVRTLQARDFLNDCIEGLPVDLEEIVQLFPLSGEQSHLEMFTDSSFTSGIIRVHIASWLLFNKRWPCPIHYDAVEQLQQRGKI
ncbi:MAG: hypothetical protein AAF434_07085 [Pseudomonadota bacterium]